jgi:hypothetical protein
MNVSKSELSGQLAQPVPTSTAHTAETHAVLAPALEGFSPTPEMRCLRRSARPSNARRRFSSRRQEDRHEGVGLLATKADPARQ